MTEPLISCVVAIYNVDKYLDKCISSIRNQDYRNVEIILVNDGSTDNSLEICKEHAKNDSRIRIIDQANQGANVARNAGLKEAKGEWVYFADGDDYVTNDIFSYLLNYLSNDYQVIMFSNKRIENNKDIIPQYAKDIIEFENEDDFKDLMIVTMDRMQPNRFNYKNLDAVSIWNKIYLKSFLLDNDLMFVPGFPKLQDMSFNLMVYGKAKKALFVNHVGYIYNINEGSVTKRFQKDFVKKMDILIDWFSEFDRNKNDASINEAYRGRVFTIIRSSIVLYFCNTNNDKTYGERKREFLDLYNKYAEVIKTYNINYLPFQERVLSFCIKHKLFMMCEILNHIRSIL